MFKVGALFPERPGIGECFGNAAQRSADLDRRAYCRVEAFDVVAPSSCSILAVEQDDEYRKQQSENAFQNDSQTAYRHNERDRTDGLHGLRC